MARTIDRDLWERWRSRLRRFESWDGTVGEFCRREGVSLASFYQWRRKLQDVPAGARPPAFVPVLPRTPDVSQPSETVGVVVVTLSSGARVEFPVAAGALVERVVLGLDSQGMEERS